MGRRKLSPRLRANRANARKSTGPRTPSGKQISSMNALVHGLASETQVVMEDPTSKHFAQKLCYPEMDESGLCLAQEVTEAQLALNAVRAYKMLLHRLAAIGADAPLPITDLLDDPCFKEFFEYMLTGELEFWFGPREKDDWRLFARTKRLMFRLAKTSKKPQLQLAKIARYEQAAMKKRQVAIIKWDAYKASK